MIFSNRRQASPTYYNGPMAASASILATRAGLPVYIAPPPPKVVVRTRLIEWLDEGLSSFG